MQLAGVSNMSAHTFNGLQMSGVSNIASGMDRGLQLSGILNVSSGMMRGWQWSLTLSGTYYSRRTHYNYYYDKDLILRQNSTVRANTFETKIGLTCRL